MPCAVSQGEIDWFKNEQSNEVLRKIGIPVDKNNESNNILCKLCSQMTLEELREKGLERWYLNHMVDDVTYNRRFDDSEKDMLVLINTILRLYGGCND